MPTIGIAELLVKPVFTGAQQKVSREIGRMMPKAGKDAGQKLGKGMADGFDAKTAGLEAEIGKLAKSVAEAEKTVTASKAKVTKASEVEAKALEGVRAAELKLQQAREASSAKVSQMASMVEQLSSARDKAATAEKKAIGDIRIAELKLQEVKENSRAKASQVAAAEQKLETVRAAAAAATERREAAEAKLGRAQDTSVGKSAQLIAAEEKLEAARQKVTAATERRESSEAGLASATADLTGKQQQSSKASADLETHMRRTSDESANTERSMSRLGTTLANAFKSSPLSGLADLMRRDGDKIRLDLHKLANDVSQQGTRGGRAFTQGFILSVGGLSAITPALGALSGSAVAAAGAVVALGSALGQLGGLAALAPAGLMAAAAGAGVLATAFHGVGDALKAMTEASGATAGGGVASNPRLAAMAVEDAMMAITVAEENAAQAQENAARRVSDAKRSLQDTIEAVAEAEKAAAEAQVQAARRVKEAKVSLQDVIADVAERQRKAARTVELAERREAEAAKEVVAAQNALVEAREKAAARVAEVGRKVNDANLKATDSALALQRATEAYNAAKADPKAGALQLAQLQNNMAKAQAADKQAKRAVVELRDEQKVAQAEAKAGGAAVLAAEEKLAKARQSEADAVYARKEAEREAVKQQKEGARQVADAQQAVTDALADQKRAHADVAKAGKEGAEQVAMAQQAVKDATRDAERAQKDSARAVEQAHRGLERVQLQQEDAAARAADASDKAGEKAAEAMGKLTPNAQSAVRALLAVYDQLGGIRRIAQENFFAGFVGPLMSLAGTVMPQLATGVGAIASALGSGTQQLMNSLNTAFAGGVLEGLLLTVADSITIMNRAIDPLVQSFVTLGVVGMDYMPRLATWIGELATQFNDFIQTAAADGSLDTWIEAGIQGLKDIGSIIGSVVGIFSALNDAAAAGGIVITLGSLAEGLRNIEAVMSGPVFQQVMGTIFTGAADSARGLLSALDPIGEAFRVGAESFADFLRLGGEIAGMLLGGLATALSNPAFGDGLITFMEGLKAGVADIVPMLPGLTDAFGRILTAAAPIVQQLGPSLIEVFTFFADTIGFVLEMLQPLLTALAGSPAILGLLIGAFVATAGASAALTAAGNIQRIAMGLWIGITKTWTLVTKGAKFAMDLLGGSIKKFPGMWIITLIGLLVGALIWFFTETEVGKELIKKAWEGIQFAIKWAWQNVIKPVVNAIVTFVRDVLAPAFKWLYENIIKPVWGWISSAIKFAWENIIKPIFAAVKWYLNNVVGPVFKWLYENVIKPVWDNISNAIRNTWNNKIKPVLKALGDFIEKTVKPAFKRGVDGIKGIWNTIQEIAAKPINFVIDTVYNKGLRKAINAVRKIVGGDPLPELDKVTWGQKAVGSGSGGPMRAFAKGGFAAPGWALVGEEGPELVNFSNPGRVYTATETQQALGAGHGPAKGMPAMGGWAADAWDAIKAGARKATEWVRGGLASAAGLILNPIKNGLAALLPDTGLGDLAKKASSSVIDGALDWIRGKDKMETKTGSTAAVFDGPLGSFHRPSRGPYTSFFGNRPAFGDFHTGVDIAGGGPTFAALNGLVSQVGNDPVGGIFIRLNHGKGFSTYYGHNPVGGPKVKVGQQVKAGQVIGAQGQTGLATGVHVHFQTEKNGQPVNPMAYLHDNGGVLNPGLSMILNNTRKPEAIYNHEQNRALQTLAARGAQVGTAPAGITVQGDVYGANAHEIYDVLDTKRRRELAMNNMRSIRV